MRVKRLRPRGRMFARRRPPRSPPRPRARSLRDPPAPARVIQLCLFGNVEGLPDVDRHGTTFNSSEFPGIDLILSM